MLLKNIDLQGRSIDEVFLPHRPEADPENYRVGKVDDKLVVYNPDTCEFMEYFYDDRPDLEWFNLEFFDIKLKNYKISRDGRCLGRGNKILKPGFQIDYPTYHFYKSLKMIHRLLATIFIPNYNKEETPYVDHIDRDKKNYSLSNLRWVSHKENNLNKKKIQRNSVRLIYYGYSNIERTQLVSVIDSDIDTDFSSPRITASVVKEEVRYRGLYWRVENKEVNEYLSDVGLDKLDDTLWKLHYSKAFYVHPAGVIKTFLRHYPLVGKYRGNYKRFHVKVGDGSKDYSISRVVAEVFLNDNNPLPKEVIVDHINTKSYDNRVDNLKLGSQKDNMNNPITRSKLSKSNKGLNCKKVIDHNGEIFNSVSECGKFYGVRHSVISNWIRNFPEKGFRYYNP